MRLLRASFRLKTSEAAAYRANFLMNFLFGLIPLTVSIFFWKTVYQYGVSTNVMIGKRLSVYTFEQMLTYFFLVFLVSELVNARSVATELSEKVRAGKLHDFLLKPVSYMKFAYYLFISEKIVQFANIALPFGLFVFLCRNYLSFTGKHIGVFLLSLFLAMSMNYLLYCILGLLTVWLEEISAILDLYRNISFFLAGGLFPPILLSWNFYRIVSYLPFQYILYVPIEIYMGTASPVRTINYIKGQFIWVACLTALMIFIWRKAIKKYSGYGS